MADVKKKLDALLKKHNLKTGAEWQREREARPATPPPARPAASVDPAGAAQPQRLRDMLGRLNLVTGTQLQQQRETEARHRDAGDYDVDRVIPGEVVTTDEGGFYLVRQDYPLDHRQGAVELGLALESASRHIAFSACDPELHDFDPRATIFVDTETIGLAGGSGTVAFLVGLGYFTGDCFRLEQCFMRDYDDEGPMLEHVRKLFDTHQAVVSYNGKSFDLPLLRTRFIQHRMPFRGDAIMHLDLVHAARRFWKRRLSDCSLGNIEREILGVHRHGDVPSYLIPQMWFDYLRTRDARPLDGVFYHHRMDILSLAALTGWLSRCLDAPDGCGFEHHEDRLSVVRIHFQQKQYPAVLEHGRRFLGLEAPAHLRRECLGMLGLAAKRLQLWEAMAEFWESALEVAPGDVEACLELAKHCEHRLRDIPRAEQFCLQALARASADPFAAAALQQRLQRIRRKLQRGGWTGE